MREFKQRKQSDSSLSRKRLKSNLQNAFVSLTRCDEVLCNRKLTPTFICSCDSEGPPDVTSVSSSSKLCSFNSSSDPMPCDKLCNNEILPWNSLLFSSKENGPEKSVLLRSISSSSEEDMNVNSPDSGFESATPTGRSSAVDFSDDTMDDLDKTSSTPHPLCLLRPDVNPEPVKPVEVKNEPLIACKWKSCLSTFSSSSALQDHIIADHVELCKERFSCLWLGCRVYDTPARNRSWLRHHVSSHTGRKRFKCVLDGCEATFNTTQGVARHVQSHFNDFNIPKARVVTHNDRRLVKRRRVRNERKGLANTHDCIDKRSLEFMQRFLVKREESSIRKLFPKPEDQVLCTRTDPDGGRSMLNRCSVWSKLDRKTAFSDEGLFLSKPTKRRRKYEILS